MRAVALMLAVLVGVTPASTLAFETVDTLPFPSGGAFTAWPADPVGPWTVFGYGGLMYDSNLFRRSTGEESDMVARFGAGGRTVNRIVGRQRVLLEGFGEYYDYDSFDNIDHFGYGLRGNWLWEIGNNMDGVVGYRRRHEHADLGEFRVDRRIMVTTDTVTADGGYRFTPNWRIFAGAEHMRAERDTDFARVIESSTLRTSLTYRTPLGNALGVEARGTRGDAQIGDAFTGFAITDDYEEREIAATLIYVLGAQLSVSGRFGHTEREYDVFTGRDFDGPTYRGVLSWLPTQKVILSFTTYRQIESLIDVNATHVLTRGNGVNLSWAPGFKLVFTAGYLDERREYEGDLGQLLGLPARDETVRVWRFGAGWEPQRHWQVGAGLDVGDRSSNQPGSDYEYYQVMLNVRYTY